MDKIVKDTLLHIQKLIAEAGATPALSVVYDEVGECWQGWITIYDSWGISPAYNQHFAVVEVASYDDTLISLSKKVKEITSLQQILVVKDNEIDSSRI